MGCEDTSRPPEDEAPERDESVPDEEERRRRFIEGLKVRGEAAEPDEHGQLRDGATHEIVKKGSGEPPEVRRRRFSLG